MAGVYQDFLAHLRKTGVAKTANYQLAVPIIPALQNTFPSYDRTLALRCETTEFPGRQFVTNDSRTYGPIYKTPYQSLYQDITLNFLETSDFFIRTFFELWMNFVWDAEHNTLNFPDSYRMDVGLTQYDMFSTAAKFNDKTGNIDNGAGLDVVATWQLINAWPTAVNQMPVTWTEDGLHRVTVTLAYEWYRIIKPGKPKPAITSGSSTNPTQGSAVQ